MGYDFMNSFYRFLDIIKKRFNPRSAPFGEGKHAKGHRHPANYRTKLKAQRKAEREHRKRVRRQLAGRKHRR